MRLIEGITKQTNQNLRKTKNVKALTTYPLYLLGSREKLQKNQIQILLATNCSLTRKGVGLRNPSKKTLILRFRNPAAKKKSVRLDIKKTKNIMILES